MNSRRHTNPLFLLMVFFSLTVLTPSAQAVEIPASTPEEVAIAFFKTDGITPNFEFWARNSDTFKRTAPTRVAKYVEGEKRRLSDIWHNYNPEEDFIVVKTRVDLNISARTPKDQPQEYWLNIQFIEGDPSYFPIIYQNYKFALIPQKMETLLRQSLKREQFDVLHQSLGATQGYADLYVQLKPVRAHTNQPFIVDGEERWMLLCDVIGMEIKREKSEDAIWNYSADWYVSPVREELQDLYIGAGAATP